MLHFRQKPLAQYYQQTKQHPFLKLSAHHQPTVESSSNIPVIENQPSEFKIKSGVTFIKELHTIIDKLKKINELKAETDEQQGLIALWKMQGIQEFLNTFMSTSFVNKIILDKVHIPWLIDSTSASPMSISNFFNIYVLHDLKAIFEDRVAVINDSEEIDTFNDIHLDKLNFSKQFSAKDQIILFTLKKRDQDKLTDDLIFLMGWTVKILYKAMLNHLNNSMRRIENEIVLIDSEAKTLLVDNLTLIDEKDKPKVHEIINTINTINFKDLISNIKRNWKGFNCLLNSKYGIQKKLMAEVESYNFEPQKPKRSQKGNFTMESYLEEINSELTKYLEGAKGIHKNVFENETELKLFFEKTRTDFELKGADKNYLYEKNEMDPFQKYSIKFKSCIQNIEKEILILTKLHETIKQHDNPQKKLSLLIAYHNSKVKKLMNKYNQVQDSLAEKKLIYSNITKKLKIILLPMQDEIDKIQELDQPLVHLLQWITTDSILIKKKNIEQQIQYLGEASKISSAKENIEINIITIVVIMNFVSTIEYQSSSQQIAALSFSLTTINYPQILCLRHLLMHSVARLNYFYQLTHSSKDDLQQVASYIHQSLSSSDTEAKKITIPIILIDVIKQNEEKKKSAKNPKDLIEIALLLVQRLNQAYEDFNPNSCLHFRQNKIVFLSKSITNINKLDQTFPFDSRAHFFDGILQLTGEVFLTIKDIPGLPVEFRHLIKEMEYIALYRSCKTHSGYVNQSNVTKVLQIITSPTFIENLKKAHEILKDSISLNKKINKG